MNDNLEFVLRALSIGMGATLVMDAWAWGLRRFGIPSLDFALLGRWIGHFQRGQLFHERIATSAPIRGERALGWITHYAIGVAFSALLLGVCGLTWAREPSPLPPLLIGLGTVAAPLFVLQPALGAGIASSKTPRPLFNSLKSLMTHVVFGYGMYLAAQAGAQFR